MDGLEPVLPLLLAIVFGAAIGVERQWHHKSAGIKTNTLVALGAAGFSMLSARGFGPGNNPAQLAAAVVTGIGFIGAGVIIHRGASVQGVNTAATLWASASMGVAIGGRHYAVGASLFAAVLVVQLSASSLERVINRLASSTGATERSEIVVTCPGQSRVQVDAAWRELATAKGLVTERRSAGPDRWSVVFRGAGLPMLDIAAFEEQVLKVPGVRQIDIRSVESESVDASLTP
jgi:putative Mg2+ transporter-C (MgtC) family protein